MLHKHEDPNLIVNIYIGYHGGSTWKRKAPHFLVNQKAMEENDFVIHILSFFFIPSRATVCGMLPSKVSLGLLYP